MHPESQLSISIVALGESRGGSGLWDIVLHAQTEKTNNAQDTLGAVEPNSTHRKHRYTRYSIFG